MRELVEAVQQFLFSPLNPTDWEFKAKVDEQYIRYQMRTARAQKQPESTETNENES